jgi:hypothetical protein
MDALLIQMVTDGVQDHAISERFWREHQLDVSRNAIIGRRSRLRAAGKLQVAPRPPGRAAVRKSRAIPSRLHPWRGPTIKAPPPNDRQMAAESDEVRKQVRLFDLGPCPPAAEKCRWPLGPIMAKAEFFCGLAVSDPAHVYCRQHAAEAFCGTTRRY